MGSPSRGIFVVLVYPMNMNRYVGAPSSGRGPLDVANMEVRCSEIESAALLHRWASIESNHGN